MRIDLDLEAIKARIGERIGAASVCWEPVPSGVFCSTAASMIADNLMATVEDWIAAARAPLVARIEQLEAVATAAQFEQAVRDDYNRGTGGEARMGPAIAAVRAALAALHPQEQSDDERKQV